MVRGGRRPKITRRSHGLRMWSRAQSEPRTKGAASHDEGVETVGRSEAVDPRSVVYERNVADVARPGAVFVDDFGGEQVTQTHGGLLDLADDDVAGRAFAGVAGEVSAWHVEFDGVGDACDAFDRHGGGSRSGSSWRRRWSIPSHPPARPPIWPASAPGPERIAATIGPSAPRSARARGRRPCRRASRRGRRSGGRAGGAPPSSSADSRAVAHDPAFVAIISGIVATATTVSKHDVEAARSCSRTRPFTLSPM